MLQLQSFVLGPFETNAYVLTSGDKRKGIIIDPGMEPDVLVRAVQDIEIEAILLTHAHLDHIGGVDPIRKLKSCPVYLHQAEAEWLTVPELNGSTKWGDMTGPISSAPPDFELYDGQELSFLGYSIQVFHTPGHSPGSVSFVLKDEGCVFSGDVLFKMSVGRTDLRGSDPQALYDSIHDKLFKLDGLTKVFPGHGPSTTINFEMEHNPFV